ncbi:hypothetical protein BH11ACT3_BH11ACT3_22990 [soil metagenome]
MAENTPVPLNRTERVLVSVAGSIGGLSLVAILAVIIARVAGFTGFTSGAWPVVLVLPGIGLPVTLVVLIVFFVVRVLHQRRLLRDGGN